MTSPIATGTASASAWPVNRSTSVSAMIWPLPRASPAARALSAARVSAAYAATPWATGSSAVR